MTKLKSGLSKGQGMDCRLWPGWPCGRPEGGKWP